MICRSCRTVHDSKPKDCPPGCPCQHKGSVELRAEEPKPVRWGCHVCGVTFPMTSTMCHCEEIETSDNWYNIYEHELPNLGA